MGGIELRHSASRGIFEGAFELRRVIDRSGSAVISA